MKQQVSSLSQSELVNAIKSNNSKALKRLYVQNYAKLEALVLQQGGSHAFAKTVYQDAFVVLCAHIKTNLFSPYGTISIEAYLFKIGKGLWHQFIEMSPSHANVLNIDAAAKLKVAPNFSSEHYKILQRVMINFKHMGGPCKQLLKDCFFKKKTVKKMAQEAQVKDANIRQQKQLCVQRLETFMATSTF